MELKTQLENAVLQAEQGDEIEIVACDKEFATEIHQSLEELDVTAKTYYYDENKEIVEYVEEIPEEEKGKEKKKKKCKKAKKDKKDKKDKIRKPFNKKLLLTVLSVALALVILALAVFGLWTLLRPTNSSNSDGPKKTYKDTYPKICQNGEGCDFGEWSLVRSEKVSCTNDGVKKRVCKNDENHVDYEIIEAHGHNFGNIGVCSVCDTEATLPKANKNAYYNDITDGYTGSGDDYDRYQLETDDYFQVTLGGTDVWFEFSVPEPGQYAVITTATNGATLTRFDASYQYINYDDPHEAKVLGNGNLLSTVVCSEAVWSYNWKATFRISGDSGSIVKFYIVRIADAPWTPSTVTNDVIAQETRTVADNGPHGTVATEVPYSTTYFYDETTGYYRMGSEKSPGAIIYAAITASAPRLFSSETPFTGPAPGSMLPAPNLKLEAGTTIEGDYIVDNYFPFIYDEEKGGSSKGYANFVNEDGLHPVTKELYEFLNAYVSEHTPGTAPSMDYAANAWLAPCYYYALLTQGSQSYPFESTEWGSFTVTPYTDHYVYATFKPTVEGNAFASADSTVYAKITVNDGVRMRLNGQLFDNIVGGEQEIQELVFAFDPTKGVTLELLNRDFSLSDIQVTITQVESGHGYNPIVINELGEIEFTPIEFIGLTGYYQYETFYVYTATENGTFSLTSNTNATFALNGIEITETNNIVDVVEGETVIIRVTSDSVSPVNATLSFTAAS